MQFSEDTLKIFKNFADINESIHFKKGSRLVSMHPQKFVLGEAIIKEELPMDFTIYKLTNLLAVSSFFTNPDFEFKKDKILVKSDNRFVSYAYADPSCVIDAYEKSKTLKLPDNLAEFSLSKDELKSLKQAASVMGLPHITFDSDGECLSVVAQDVSNDSLGAFVLKVDGAKVEKAFKLVMSFPNLKVIEDDYAVTLSSSIAHFVSKNAALKYWILLEITSSTTQ